jgi:hypothetical protein
MKAIFLDAEKRKIIPLGYIPDLSSLQRMVGGWIEVLPAPDMNCLVINEEGRLKGLRYGFQFPYHGMLFGSGVILGPSNAQGENTPITLEFGFVQNLVVWWQRAC